MPLEPTETLSAPAVKSAATSFVLEIPPPTVRGIKTASAVAETSSKMVERPSLLAFTSRNVISSAPSR